MILQFILKLFYNYMTKSRTWVLVFLLPVYSSHLLRLCKFKEIKFADNDVCTAYEYLQYNTFNWINTFTVYLAMSAQGQKVWQKQT